MAKWNAFETVPTDRPVFVSNGTYVLEARVGPLGFLLWDGDGDMLLSDATHWTEMANVRPEPPAGFAGGRTAFAVFDQHARSEGLARKPLLCRLGFHNSAYTESLGSRLCARCGHIERMPWAKPPSK